MSLKDKYNLDSIGNRAQELVYDVVERLIESGISMCTCEACVQDLVAWTLNHVEPAYYTSLLAPLHDDFVRRRQEQLQLDHAVATGLQRLRARPHHD